MFFGICDTTYIETSFEIYTESTKCEPSALMMKYMKPKNTTVWNGPTQWNLFIIDWITHRTCNKRYRTYGFSSWFPSFSALSFSRLLVFLMNKDEKKYVPIHWFSKSEWVRNDWMNEWKVNLNQKFFCFKFYFVFLSVRVLYIYLNCSANFLRIGLLPINFNEKKSYYVVNLREINEEIQSSNV